MAKIPNCVKTVFSICGGWASAMSGGLSVPFAILALIYGGKAGMWLAVAAYAGLWVLAGGLIKKNRDTVERHKQESESQEKARAEKFATLDARIQYLENQIPNLDIEVGTVGINDSFRDKRLAAHFGQDFRTDYYFRISCKTAIAENVEVKLLSVEPSPLELGKQFHLTLEPGTGSSRTINPGDHSDFPIFCVNAQTSNTIQILNHKFELEYENPKEQDNQKLVVKKYSLKIGLSSSKSVQQIHNFTLTAPPEILTLPQLTKST